MQIFGGGLRDKNLEINGHLNRWTSADAKAIINAFYQGVITS